MFLGSRMGLAFGKLLFLLAAVGHADAIGFFIAAQGMGLLFEAWRGTATARKRLGYPLTNDQRVRVALWYTLGMGAGATVLALAVLGLMVLQVLPPTATGLDSWSLLGKLASQVSGRGVAILIGAGFIFHAALVLLRYLLLSLFNPRR
jgi:hypothetical protein